jgi:hypothetical protein
MRQIHTFIPLTLYPRAETSQIFLRGIHILPKLLTTRNTADVTGCKLIAIKSQSISGVSAINVILLCDYYYVSVIINPLVAFYDIHERKGEVL